MIAFTRENVNEGIMRARADGTRLHRLSKGRDSVADYSPDGTKIAFLRDVSDGDWLMVADANGDNKRRLAYIDAWNFTCFNSQPFDWSPDSTELVYQSDERKSDGETDLHVISADGTGDRVIVTSDMAEVDAVWSPDGTRIAFTRQNEECSGAATKESEVQDIWTVAADGTDERRLTEHSLGDFEPAWSPDGSSIAFISTRDDTADPDYGPYTSEVYVMNADGSDERRLTDDVMYDYGLSWAPDGTWIAFAASCDDDSCDWDSEIKKVRADGSRVVPLTDNKRVRESYPEWSPDGRKIAYARTGYRRENFDIWVVTRDGSDHERVTDTRHGDELSPTWR